MGLGERDCVLYGFRARTFGSLGLRVQGFGVRALRDCRDLGFRVLSLGLRPEGVL